MYSLARPQISIPVHGEFIHTKAHCELALESGVNRIVQAENGMAIRLSANLGSTEIVGKVKSGYFGVDGNQLIDLKSEIIRERKKLQEAGIVFISIALNDSLKILARPEIITVGSYDLNRDQESEDFIREEINLFFKNRARELDLHDGFGLSFLKKKKKRLKIQESKIIKDLESQLRSRLLKIFEDLMGKRPALEVVISMIN
jgi:mRNA degradation ribonuclease J1/J2